VRGRVNGVADWTLDLPCVLAEIKRRCRSEGQFSGNSAQKNHQEHCKKNRDGGVGSVVANHRGGGESSVVVTTLAVYN